MAEGFSVDILGLDEIIDSFASSALTKKLLPAFGLAVSNFHKTLESEIKSVYNTRKNLSSVMVGGNLRNKANLAGKIMEAGLTYNEVPLPLSQFIAGTRRIYAQSRFMATYGRRRGSLIPKNWATEVYVEVRKGDTKLLQGPNGYGGFITQNKAGNGRAVMMRKQDATWIVEPIQRAAYAPVYTIGLAQMAANVFERPRVQEALDKMESTIIENFIV